MQSTADDAKVMALISEGAKQDSGGLDDVEASPPWASISSTNDPDQIIELSALDRQVARPASAHTCLRCRRTFPQKKTLNRHMKSVHPSTEDDPNLCLECGISFKRKDILSRHVATQHGGQWMVKCEICRKQVRPRVLSQHRKSRVCRVKATQAIIPARDAATLRARDYGSASVPGYPDPIVHVLAISAWLLIQLKPWGKGQESSDLWLLKSTVVATPEVLRFRGRAFRTVRKALRNYNPRSIDPHLTEAVVVLSIVERMINGWEATKIHREATLNLERRAIAAFGRTRDFANDATKDAYMALLPKDVDDAEVQKCWQLISTGLTLVRACTLSIIETADSEQAAGAEVSDFKMDRWVRKNAAGLAYLADLASSIKKHEPKSQRSTRR